MVAWVLIIVLGVSAVSLRHAGARLLEDWFRRGVLVRNATIAALMAILAVIAILSLTNPL